MRALSATTLKLFQECPRCFWLHVNRKIERPRGPFPSLPSGIDRVLKIYFDAYRDATGLPPLIQGRLDGRLSTTPLTLGFNDPATGARLWGKLDDCVILPAGRLAPLDHKTRASAPADISYSEKYYKFQMDVYTLLLERNGHATSRTAYLVYYFPEDGALHDGFPFGVDVHKIKTDPETAYAVFAGAARCLTGPLPACGAECGFCRWAETRRVALGTESPLAPGLGAAPPRRRDRSAAGEPSTPASAPAFPEDLFT
ncbi:MAG TPA: PD-(D/E)XK nuclease family protein [bacterium]